MSERKNIDRLFQEKFKEFEPIPSEDVWTAIEARLNEKKKRRIIPFWWKLSGVAALLLIGFLVSKSINTREIQTENSVVIDPNSKKNEKINGIDNNSKELNGKGTIKSENPVVNQLKIEKEKENESEINFKNSSNTSNKNSVTTSVEDKKSTVTNKTKQLKIPFYSSKSEVADRKSSQNHSLKKNSNTPKESDPNRETVFEKTKNQLAQNNNNLSNPEKDSKNNELSNQVVENKLKENKNLKPSTPFEKKNIVFDDLKESSISKIETTEVDKKVNDTVPKNSVATNVLEELLNEKESKLKQESKRNRWQITSNVAPIFLGSVSNGSPIDSTLSNNSKSFNTNVGFGLGVSYSVNKKFSIRTGLNKVNMSYNTNDILFFSSLESKTLKNVRPTASSRMIQVQSRISNNTSIPSETELLSFENNFTNKNNGVLRQEMGFLEMPLEMTYNLLNKKFGLKIIGGFSTLFLQDNNITIVSNGRETLLGEANNLNDIHFSTNLGLGVKYNFLKSFEFNIEPTLKYQLNTFNANAGNFKPYFFGIYSGVSYNF
jgi:hypothetical protein